MPIKHGWHHGWRIDRLLPSVYWQFAWQFEDESNWGNNCCCNSATVFGLAKVKGKVEFPLNNNCLLPADCLRKKRPAFKAILEFDLKLFNPKKTHKCYPTVYSADLRLNDSIWIVRFIAHIRLIDQNRVAPRGEKPRLWLRKLSQCFAIERQSNF